MKAGGSDISVVGEQPKDKFASIRSECYEALVKTAKQLSEEFLLFTVSLFVSLLRFVFFPRF